MICGDYKVTVNPQFEVDKYPIPKPEELFATLTGQKKFTTLELTHAYQQMPLEEQAWGYLMINTHRRLYRYLRLPFGVSPAPAIVQRMVDTILQGIPHVVCCIDDILITGVDDDNHLKKLGEVLRRLQQHRICLRLKMLIPTGFIHLPWSSH